jgi:ParB family chromosome partitioning protein
MRREFVEVDIDEVTLKESIREDVGDIGMLTASVSKVGLLNPILIDRSNILITGARRIAACRAAGIRQLPAIRLDTDYNSMAALDIQVDMNLCRQPLTGKEVEKLIGKKRLAASRQNADTPGGMLSRFKQLFGND